jgi:hypothetical protein
MWVSVVIRTRIAVCACVLSSAGAVLTGCNDFSLDIAWRSGNYVLIEVDTRGQMYLAFDEKNGAPSALVGPTVFSIGTDDQNIVVKQHPSTNEFGGFNRAVTNYFIVDRTFNSAPAERQKAVRGPLGEEEFKKLSVTQSLPPFTKTFDDLK